MPRPTAAPPQQALDAVEAAAGHHAVELPVFPDTPGVPENPGAPDDLPGHGGEASVSIPDFPQLSLPEGVPDRADANLPNEDDLAAHLPEFIFDIG